MNELTFEEFCALPMLHTMGMTCVWECRHDLAVATRKVKPYPAVPDDIEEAPEVWQTVGAFMLTAIFGALAVICLVLFFTGVWVWSLLI